MPQEQAKRAETPGPRTTLIPRAFLVILGLYLLFGTIHVFSTPLGETGYQDAPDEAAHVSYVQTLASGHLPTKMSPHAGIDSKYPDYEWHQPPLYYLVATLVLPLGYRAVRFLSLLCGLGSLMAIFRTAQLLSPHEGVTSLTAVGIAALTPAHIAILSSVNNDPLLELCFSVVLYLLVRSFKVIPDKRHSLLLGLAVSAAILTKTTALVLLPVVGAGVYLCLRSGIPRQAVTRHAAIVCSICLALTGWWFVRNAMLYGQPLPMHEFNAAFAHTTLASDVVTGSKGPKVDGWTGYWMLVLQWCFKSFWAVYGNARSAAYGVPLFMSDGLYLLMLGFMIASFVGLARVHLQRMILYTQSELYGFNIELMTLCLVGGAYVLFVSHYFQTQGRYLYPAMSAISIMLSVGWLSLFPVRYRKAACGGLLALLGLVCAAFLLQTSNRSVSPATDQSSTSVGTGTYAYSRSF